MKIITCTYSSERLLNDGKYFVWKLNNYRFCPSKLESSIYFIRDCMFEGS